MRSADGIILLVRTNDIQHESDEMEFGSKFVYYYNESDEECVSDEEYSNGITDER